MNCTLCGESVGGGGVLDALIVSDVDFDTGSMAEFRLCRVPGRFDSNQPTVSCADSLLALIPGAAGYAHRRP